MTNTKSATPSSVVGACRLCGEKRNLCASHLMPAGLYRGLRSRTTPHPLIITSKATFTSSRQVKEYLLCVECEERFRTHGENWVQEHCFKREPEFKLRDLLLECQPVSKGPLATFYAGSSNSRIDSERLTYFAASVFWRASVHEWNLPVIGRKAPINLGPCESLFQNYLSGRSLFPQSAALWTWVSRAQIPSRVVDIPHTRHLWNCEVHSFNIPGIRFDLFVGRELPSFVRAMCTLNGPDRPILLSDVPDMVLASHVEQMSTTTRLSKGLTSLGNWRWTR